MPPQSKTPTAGFDTGQAVPAEPAPPAVIASPARRRAGPALFRVVEVVRDDQGRLVRHGQIWQPDLDRARRFGRVLAANSAAEKVLVADESGAVVEAIAEPVPDARPMGWDGWRELPLPPMPRAASVAQRRRAPPKPLHPPPDAFPLLEDALSEVERTATLPPVPGPG
jgi:hypothetical protein